MIWKSVFIFCATIYLVIAKHEKYEGYGLYEISVNNLEEVEIVNEIENQLHLDVWAHCLPGHAGQVLVPKPLRNYFQDVITAKGLKFKVLVDNIKEKIDQEDELLAAAKRVKKSSPGPYLPIDTIYEYDKVNEYLEELAAKYSEIVTLETAGKTFEGRDIKYLKISSSKFEDSSKPIVMMQSLLHAREWVTLPATLYAIQKLVHDVTEKDLLDRVDWIIIPIANPDGYQYTHDKERFWRKNRATGYFAGDVCMGVDLNRNFNYNWGADSSSFVCSETFHGNGATSEPETAAIESIIREYHSRIKLFLDIHSFGSYILYGYGNGQLPSNALIINLAGVQMAQAIDAVKWPNHPNYRVGNTALLLYKTSGTAQDCAQEVTNKLAYTFELPAYNNFQSVNGFLVDPAFIEQAGYETWQGIKTGAWFVVNNNI